MLAAVNGTDELRGSEAHRTELALNGSAKNASAVTAAGEVKDVENKFVKGVDVSAERLRTLGVNHLLSSTKVQILTPEELQILTPEELFGTLGVNHLSFDMGGKALATNQEARSESALLKSDKDKYWISPCKVEKGVMWVVLELNEIIHVRTIVIGSFEYYSSTPHRFQQRKASDTSSLRPHTLVA